MAARRSALVRLQHFHDFSRAWLAPANRAARWSSHARAMARGSLRRPRGSRAARTGARMRVALINPNWRYDGSIYFGCRSPHLPIELGLSQRLLQDAGHATLLLD